MMSEPAAPPRRRARGWGIAATIVAGIGILAVGLVFLLAATVDPLWGWMLFVALPISVAAGAIGGVLGIVGLITARGERAGYGWPVAGVVLGGGQVLLGSGLLGGWFV